MNDLTNHEAYKKAWEGWEDFDFDADTEGNCMICGIWVFKMWKDYDTLDGSIHRICAESCRDFVEEEDL